MRAAIYLRPARGPGIDRGLCLVFGEIQNEPPVASRARRRSPGMRTRCRSIGGRSLETNIVKRLLGRRFGRECVFGPLSIEQETFKALGK